MTIDLLRRLSGSALSRRCSPSRSRPVAPRTGRPVTASGTGGDIVHRAAQPALRHGTSAPAPAVGIRARGGRRLLLPFQPQFGSTIAAAVPPPAISGGTLRILADGDTAVAADPDRDQVYIVDLDGKRGRRCDGRAARRRRAGPRRRRRRGPRARRAPPRRRAGQHRSRSRATIARSAARSARRRAALAYDAATDLVHVACADGELVSLPAAGGAADAHGARWTRDLRDVVVDGAAPARQPLPLGGDADRRGRRHRVRPHVARRRSARRSARGGQSSTRRRRLARWRDARRRRRDDAAPARRRRREVQPVVGGYGGFEPVRRDRAPGRDDGGADGNVAQRAGDGGHGAGGRHGDLARRHSASPSSSAGNATNSESRAVQPALPRVFVTDTGRASPTTRSAACPTACTAPAVPGGGTPSFRRRTAGRRAGPAPRAARHGAPPAATDRHGRRPARSGTPPVDLRRVRRTRRSRRSVGRADRRRVRRRGPASSSSRASRRCWRSRRRAPSRCRPSAAPTPATTVFHANAGGVHRLRLVPRRGQRRRPHLELHLRGHAPHAVAAGRPARHRAVPLGRRRDRLPDAW